LVLNSFMAREQGSHVQRLLAIHHHYAALLNLKNAVNRQLSEAQDIFIYGKSVDGKSFQETAAQVGTEMQRLQAAVDLTEALPVTVVGDEIDSGRVRMVELQHQYEDLYRELVLMTMLIQSGRKAKAQEHFQTEISRRFGNFFNKIDGWLVVKKEQLASTEEGFVSINEQHNRTSLIALVAIMVIVLFFSGVFVYLLGPRLRDMLRGTERISKGDFSIPVRVEGNDEFSRLALSMNQMMADLATSRKKLLEQSYYSGMADMVSGTLHNLRNALAPIVIELEEQQRALVGLRLERMVQACAELKGGTHDVTRHADLIEYLELSLVRLHEGLGQTAEGMALTRNKVGVVEKVLNQHSYLARMERPREIVVLAEVVNDCLGLVPQDALATIPVLVDDSV
ncbi:MAG: HAMP domain-containing protein, partial [Desulfobulbaceae bacterium]|nr:HAMP domain-containing protein [Desulfobulbaceae bacterium]